MTLHCSCGAPTRVIESRTVNNTTMRTRACEVGHKFVTKEVVVPGKRSVYVKRPKKKQHLEDIWR